MKLSHLPAGAMISYSGINRNTFYQRIDLRNIEYIQPFRGTRLYSVKDWNKKNPDYQITPDSETET
ncbi:MAG: hypothetical protein NUV65_00870 [Candidatus Roizmanbacteria bacterium]|nr:hypothetical protein [Candidatus Roizmanbacteria bacterium]